MKISPFIKNTTDFIFEKCSKDLGSVLIWTTISGWVASSTAQIIGICINSKYTKEQKKFMINQELADAAVNILSYFALTMPLKKLATKLVSTGKIMPKDLITTMIRHGDTKRIGKLDFNVTQQPYFDKIEKHYNSFNNFMSTSAAVLGGVVSSNIITPILRNRYASKRQNSPMPFENARISYNAKINKQSPFNTLKKHNMSI